MLETSRDVKSLVAVVGSSTAAASASSSPGTVPLASRLEGRGTGSTTDESPASSLKVSH